MKQKQLSSVLRESAPALNLSCISNAEFNTADQRQ